MASQRPPDPAARLKLAREAKGLSAKQVAEATKLSVRAVEALESGRIRALPAGIYRRSIIRAVAREAGLNPDQILCEFSSAYPDDLPAPDTACVPDTSSARPRSRQRVMTFAGAILPIVAGIGYFAWSDRPAPVIARDISIQRKADVWRPEIVPAGGFLEPPPAVRRPVVLTLTISSRCELRVMADGREILGRIVEAGETMPVEMADEVILSGNNAAAVQFSINGQAGRALGAPGERLAIRLGRDDYDTFLVRH